MGVAAGKGSEKQMQAARDYAAAIGLAFQIRDDMLDVIGDAKKLGKATQADGKKNTFVSLYGLERCTEWIEEENKKALAALDAFDDREFMIFLAKSLTDRRV